MERMEEKEDDYFVGKGRGQRVFSHRFVLGAGSPLLWMADLAMPRQQKW